MSDELPRPLGQLADWAAEVLPSGWKVELHIERHAGWVVLLNPDGETVEFPTNRESVEEEFQDAIEYAIANDKGEDDAT